MKYYKELSNQPLVATLQQVTELTWDGDVISKSDRDTLYKDGLIIRYDGWNIINDKGIQFLVNGGFINK